jgi:TRAP transporter 4TM/12TM fusion protein
MSRQTRVVSGVSLVFWAIVIAYALTQRMPRARFGIAFLGAITAVYVLDGALTASAEGDRRELGLLLAAGAVALVTAGYMFFNFDVLYSVRVGYALDYEYVLAGLFVLSMLYLTFREFGVIFLAILLVAIVYGLFGSAIPGVLGHGGITPTRMLRIMVLEIDGFFGILTRLVGAWLALFLLYAGFLQAYGGFDLMIRLAVRTSRYIRSGVAQSAVIASMVIGSINGSTAANTAMTGSFTIPLMKKNGLRSETAGAIESVASTVGQVLPPVMGAGAFIMASLLGIEYATVVVAGTLPALVMVSSIGIGVHYTSISQVSGVQIDMEEFVDTTKTTRDIAIEAVQFLIPFLVLVYTLGIAQYTVITAALYTTFSMALTGTTIPITRAALGHEPVPEAVRRTLGQTVEGARVGALSLAGIAIIIAAINGVVTILLTTGVPSAITLALIDISGGIMLVAVVLAMIISIILGLGMPTAAAYLIVALLIAPTLSGEFGVPRIAAHFFVFYCAILAAITPPIATSVAVATGIADSDFWRTSVESIKIALPLFVLPFAFIYNPELIAGGLTPGTFVSAGLVLVGAIGITHGVNYVRRPFGVPRYADFAVRGLFVATGVVAMAYPGTAVRAGVATLVVVGLVIQRQVATEGRLPEQVATETD